jgi:hypothetical protein
MPTTSTHNIITQYSLCITWAQGLGPEAAALYPPRSGPGARALGPCKAYIVHVCVSMGMHTSLPISGAIYN